MRYASLMTLAALLLSPAAATFARGEEAPPRTITASGEAVVYVKPDEVQVGFGVETFDANLDKAREANDERSAKLLQAIKALGVEDKHLQTEAMTVEVQYRSNGRPVNGVEGYLTRRSYSVTLKDTTKFEKLIDAGLKNGANQLLGFDFRTTELRKHRDQARKMAIKAAREKAVDLAAALDAKVGPPRTINEGGVWSSFGRGFWGYGGFGANAMAQNAIQVAPGGGGGDAEGETLPLGQIAVRANVSVTFDLAP